VKIVQGGAEARLNGICPYYTMFPLDFPLNQLRKAQRGEWVLDPFCGRGTTNYAARLVGLSSVGIDSSPVAAAIAAVKIVSTAPEAVVRALRRILADASAKDIPDGEFWELCFERKTLQALCCVREALLEDCSSAARIALRALILGSLHGPLNQNEPSHLSNQMPRTYASKPGYAIRFWRARKMRPPNVDLTALVERKARWYFLAGSTSVGGRIRCGDSRKDNLMPLSPPITWVVTSPPYYGMRTYVPDQWLRYWFLGGPSEVSYVLSGQLTHQSPDDFAAELAEVWSNVATACRPGAHLIVRFGGIHDRQQDASEILIDSLEEADCGWKVVSVSPAGEASHGRRQAQQFVRDLKDPIAEYDFHARLAA